MGWSHYIYLSICSREYDKYQFINVCDLIAHYVEKIKYMDLSKWDNKRKYLKKGFKSQYSASSLQLQINSLKMNHGVSKISYTNGVKKPFFKLWNIYT